MITIGHTKGYKSSECIRFGPHFEEMDFKLKEIDKSVGELEKLYQ
jgi:hypothetical protein